MRQSVVVVSSGRNGIGQAAPASGEGQIALPLGAQRDFAASRFVAAPSNAEARAWLAQLRWPERRLWLWGPTGCGKTHLLHGWVASRDGVLVQAADLAEDAFLGALPAGGVAVDGVAGPLREQALLHLLNRAREQRIAVLLAGREAPSRLEIGLADLSSRLRATLAVAIRSPDDSLRAALLMRVLAERQIIVAQPVMDWLLRRLPRTADAILVAAERLDGAALARGQGVTRKLAQEVLGDLLGEMPDEGYPRV